MGGNNHTTQEELEQVAKRGAGPQRGTASRERSGTHTSPRTGAPSGSHTEYLLVVLFVWVYQQECLDRNIFNIFVKNIRNITNVTTRTFAPVGAPRRPESPSGDIVVGRASFR
jgi:hypothetical protein